jgi:SAM-dependent methyltransferase
MVGRTSSWLGQLNARHPWSHDDYFHSWILSNLPTHRDAALDFGCGRGELVETLAPHFGHIVGVDTDPVLRTTAANRVAAVANATVSDRDLADWDDESVDLLTMIAVLHHLDLGTALTQVRRVLKPGGKFLVVGLAVPHSPLDRWWEMLSVITNPIIGWVHHPWPNPMPAQPAPFPVKDPVLTCHQIADALSNVMPGATLRRRIGFRHTVEWTKPA